MRYVLALTATALISSSALAQQHPLVTFLNAFTAAKQGQPYQPDTRDYAAEARQKHYDSLQRSTEQHDADKRRQWEQRQAQKPITCQTTGNTTTCQPILGDW